MAITQAIANAFKKQLLEGDQNFASGGDKFKLALYTSSATLNSATTAYASGGGALTGQNTSIASGVAIVDFADLSFTGVTLTARGALIYNTSSAVTNAAVAVLDFGGDKTATSGTFTVQFPAFSYIKNLWLKRILNGICYKR